MPELPWRKLIESIKRGNCILVLGPEASFDPTEGTPLTLTHKLANHLANHSGLDGNKDLVNKNDIAHVAQLFKQQHDRMDLEMAIDAFYTAYHDLTTEFHQYLAELPFSLCINTTLDNFFSNALLAKGKSPICDYYNFYRGQPCSTLQASVDKPCIYNLYGSRIDLESMVLTEDELLDFLVNVIKGSPELPPYIRSQFANKDLNFLFVGFGFHSWHNRILLHTLNAHNHRIQSLAVESQKFFGHPDCSQTAVFYSLQHKIKFEQLSWLDFAKQLHDTYKETVPIVPTTTTPNENENAPNVFLCYASEDRDLVEQLSQQLQQSGIKTWQDKQNLRAGDNWDRQLVHVIEKVVDYVVVVQTQAMTGQIEGYFHKEIAKALDRQQKFAGDFRFILPILYNNQPILSQLHSLHNIRLDAENGLQPLIEAIKSDWQQRQQRVAA